MGLGRKINFVGESRYSMMSQNAYASSCLEQKQQNIRLERRKNKKGEIVCAVAFPLAARGIFLRGLMWKEMAARKHRSGGYPIVRHQNE